MDQVAIWVTQPFRGVPVIAGMHGIVFGGEHGCAELTQQARHLPANAAVSNDAYSAVAQFAWLEALPTVFRPFSLFLLGRESR